jgi:hypothetical protein
VATSRIGSRAFRYYAPREFPIADFSGGWNIRDAPTEIADNESPDMFNMTLDERGGVAKRLGFGKVNSSVFGGGVVKNVFWWGSGGYRITQAGAKLYRDDDGVVRLTFSTSDRCGFADFVGKLAVIHPVDGLFLSTDGVTYTAVPTGPKGTAVMTSKNRLIALGDPSNGTLLSASGIADPTDWLLTAGHGWQNQIREVDSAALTAMAAVGGEDILGRPGFMLFKAGSFYRVYDSDTGAYTTMDANVGCASALAAVGVPGKVAFLSTAGIFTTDGVTPAGVPVSRQLEPLFQASQIAFDKASLFCAGVKGERIKFSLPRAGSGANDLSLEYHPVQGWIAPGSDAASCYTTYEKQTEALYGGSPTVSGQVYEYGRTGADDGAAIACRYQTKWFAPLGGAEARFRRLRVFGRGADFDIYTKLDFDTGDGEQNPVSLPGGALIWDEGSWDVDYWAPHNYEDSTDLWSLGKGQHISFVIRQTGSASAQGRSCSRPASRPRLARSPSIGSSCSTSRLECECPTSPSLSRTRSAPVLRTRTRSTLTSRRSATSSTRTATSSSSTTSRRRPTARSATVSQTIRRRFRRRSPRLSPPAAARCSSRTAPT